MLKKKIKALKNVSFGEFYQKVFNISFKPIMFFVCGVFILLFLLISLSSAESIKSYSNIFVYISFFLSFLILMASLCEKIKTLKQTTKLFILIIFIFSSISYAAIRVTCFPEYKQFEDVGTALIILISYFTIFLEREK